MWYIVSVLRKLSSKKDAVSQYGNPTGLVVIERFYVVVKRLRIGKFMKHSGEITVALTWQVQGAADLIVCS